MASEPVFPTREQEVDLRQYLHLLWTQRGVLIASLVVATIACVGYSFLIPPSFITVSKFIAKTGSGQSGMQLSSLAQLTGLNFPSKESQDPFSYLNEVISNLDFLEGILAKRWAVGGDSLTLPQIWESEPDTTEPDWRHRYLMKNVERLRTKTLKLSNDGGLRVLTVTESDPGLAFQLNRHVLDLLDDYIRNNVQSRAKENRAFIEKRIEEAQAELARSEEAMNRFRSRNLDLSSPALALEAKRLQRSVSINEEIYLQLRKEYELARIEEKKDQPLVIMVKQPELNLQKSAPKRKLFLLAGIVLGFGIGIALALGRLVLARS